jgi:hypothetical protein
VDAAVVTVLGPSIVNGGASVAATNGPMKQRVDQGVARQHEPGADPRHLDWRRTLALYSYM